MMRGGNVFTDICLFEKEEGVRESPYSEARYHKAGGAHTEGATLKGAHTVTTPLYRVAPYGESPLYRRGKPYRDPLHYSGAQDGNARVGALLQPCKTTFLLLFISNLGKISIK